MAHLDIYKFTENLTTIIGVDYYLLILCLLRYGV